MAHPSEGRRQQNGTGLNAYVEYKKFKLGTLKLALTNLTGRQFDRDRYYIPANGFKEMDLSLFLNHNDNIFQNTIVFFLYYLVKNVQKIFEHLG